MKRSTKIATTVILTIGIAGGAAAIGKHKHGSFDRKADFAVSYIADELELDSTQTQALNTLKEQMFIARETVHTDMSSTKSEITEILQGETFDQARALELINNKATTITTAAPDVILALGNFMDSLNPAQKQEVLEFIEKNHDHKKGRRGMWKH